jgi:NTE family protein
MQTNTPLTTTPSFFEGLPAEDLARIMGSLDHRLFSAGTIMIGGGEPAEEMYIVQEGQADVLISDRSGAEHLLSRVGAGGTLGEMALITGQPASATVRAASDVEALVLTRQQFENIADSLPLVYRNLGAILSRRLSRTNTRLLHSSAGRISILQDAGAPPLLGYALASSVAWHTRKPTLLIAVSPDGPPSELVELTSDAPPAHYPLAQARQEARSYGGRPLPRAAAILTRPEGPFVRAALHETVDELSAVYDHILVQAPGDFATALGGRRMDLLGAHDPQPASDAGGPYSAIRAWAQPRRLGQPDSDGSLRVPALVADDMRALREGLLPMSTDAGRALGWAARDLARLKVGLAFGGGSEKGYAHLGVWRGLERAGLPVDYLAGTSIGSAVAALYALGYKPDDGATVLDTCGQNAFKLGLSTASVLSNNGLRASLQVVGQDKRIENLQTPLAITAADITSGREIIFRRGILWQAVLASMALPGVYPPQVIGPYTLVDGGVLNPVPSSVAADMGADTVIAVRLAARSPAKDYPESREAAGKVPTMLHTITRSIEMMQSKISFDSATAATILIEVSFEDVARAGLRRWSEGRRYIDLGEAAAEAALPRITAALPWVGL